MNPRKWKVNLNHCIFMLYKSVETCHLVSLPCKGTNILIFVTCGVSFYLRVWSVQTPIQSQYPWVRCIYMQECSVHSLIHLLLPWVQCQSLKPVLSKCSQTSFVTADDFIPLCTRSYVFYSHGCNKFLHARTFFTLADTNAPIFTVLTKVWPRTNRAMVTNN